MGITKENIIALRSADTVSFHSHLGKAHISLTRKIQTKGYDSRVEVEAKVEVQTSFNGDAFAMIHASRHCRTWLTIASLIREGDEIFLEWQRDYGSTDQLKEAGFHADQLELVLKRKQGSLSFLVDYRVTKNATSRMIQAE